MTQIAESIAVHALDQLSLPVKKLQAFLFAIFEEAKLLNDVLNLCTEGTIEALTDWINYRVELYARVIRRPVSLLD